MCKDCALCSSLSSVLVSFSFDSSMVDGAQGTTLAANLTPACPETSHYSEHTLRGRMMWYCITNYRTKPSRPFRQAADPRNTSVAVAAVSWAKGSMPSLPLPPTLAASAPQLRTLACGVERCAGCVRQAKIVVFRNTKLGKTTEAWGSHSLEQRMRSCGVHGEHCVMRAGPRKQGC